ncbi:MAG: DNA gyrase subunit A [Nanoarchaeota archaeon]|nr:DNA gyrase subunit A [Nanoarchaeota archaeon]
MPKDEEILIEQEMKKAYIDYAMSVIVSRALPDVADGLKPVHRRILYAMHDMGLTADKPTRKSARIVGEVLGKYHPHGDLPVYDALSRMTQDFSMRYPLVIGQGNFGSVDGDPPAAQRYTEAKLSAIASEMLADIEKETVDFQANFDNSLEEPKVLPAKLPNLLLNGASGIAVGMATNIPPHNITEVIDAVIAYIKDAKIPIDKLIEIIPAPDFPTGGILYPEGVEELYKAGKGSFTVRAKAFIEDIKGGKQSIVITEIPYQVNKSSLITDIARLVRDKKLSDITHIRDESAKGKIRIVLEIRRSANSNVILNKLYNLTSMQTRFNGMLLAIVNGTPKLLNIKNIIEQFVLHREKVVEKRCKFDLRKAEERLHIVEGLLIALKKIDSVIQAIKKSKAVAEANAQLMSQFKLSQKQAQAILDMKLSRLTALEQKKLNDEEKSLEDIIKELNKILSSKQEILEVVKKELQEIKRKYGDDRKTKIEGKLREFKEKDLIAKETIAVTLTAKGYIKRMPLNVYREQQRGGKGITGTELTSGDVVQETFTCSTHDYLLFFTNKGKAFSMQAYNIPEATRYAKGKAVINLLGVQGENTATTLAVKEFSGNLILVTKKGIIKKMQLENFAKIRKTGIVAITLPEDDELIDALFLNEKEEIFLGTSKGIAIRFSSSDLRNVGRTAYGVIAIRLAKDDFVVGAVILPAEREALEKITILTVTEKGYGKRTSIDKYRKTSRAGKGITNLKTTPKTGDVAGIIKVQDSDGIIVTTQKGMVIRTTVKNIRQAGRSTQGVRIIKLAENDKAIGLARIREE